MSTRGTRKEGNILFNYRYALNTFLFMVKCLVVILIQNDKGPLRYLQRKSIAAISWYVLSSLWDGAFKRTIATIGLIEKSSPCSGRRGFPLSLSE